jgi:hypothetical protein
MSYITNIILFASCGDPGCALINDFTPKNIYVFRLRSIADPILPPHWTGGTKVFTPEVWIGAINGLDDLNELLTYLRSISWEAPECVQLVIRQPDEEKFELTQLFPDL